jgi:ubiquinone/menaquinone biosynthesis C-methylase UbiE
MSLDDLATFVGKDWRNAPYYDKVETYSPVQWRNRILPFIGDTPVDYSVSMDLAAGHGRNSAQLLKRCKRLHIVDINQENIDFCRNRFGASEQISYHLTNGYELPFLADDELSFVFCWDAMVHFDSDVVRQYLREFKRVLRPGGHGFLHHSNYTKNPGGDMHKNPGWRNFMSDALFAHYAVKEGLIVLRQQIVDWKENETYIDCFSLIQNPSG